MSQPFYSQIRTICSATSVIATETFVTVDEQTLFLLALQNKLQVWDTNNWTKNRRVGLLWEQSFDERIESCIIVQNLVFVLFGDLNFSLYQWVSSDLRLIPICSSRIESRGAMKRVHNRVLGTAIPREKEVDILLCIFEKSIVGIKLSIDTQNSVYVANVVMQVRFTMMDLGEDRARIRAMTCNGVGGTENVRKKAALAQGWVTLLICIEEASGGTVLPNFLKCVIFDFSSKVIKPGPWSIAGLPTNTAPCVLQRLDGGVMVVHSGGVIGVSSDGSQEHAIHYSFADAVRHVTPITTTSLLAVDDGGKAWIIDTSRNSVEHCISSDVNHPSSEPRLSSPVCSCVVQSIGGPVFVNGSHHGPTQLWRIGSTLECIDAEFVTGPSPLHDIALVHDDLAPSVLVSGSGSRDYDAFGAILFGNVGTSMVPTVQNGPVVTGASPIFAAKQNFDDIYDSILVLNFVDQSMCVSMEGSEFSQVDIDGFNSGRTIAITAIAGDHVLCQVVDTGVRVFGMTGGLVCEWVPPCGGVIEHAVIDTYDHGNYVVVGCGSTLYLLSVSQTECHKLATQQCTHQISALTILSSMSANTDEIYICVGFWVSENSVQVYKVPSLEVVSSICMQGTNIRSLFLVRDDKYVHLLVGTGVGSVYEFKFSDWSHVTCQATIISSNEVLLRAYNDGCCVYANSDADAIFCLRNGDWSVDRVVSPNSTFYTRSGQIACGINTSVSGRGSGGYGQYVRLSVCPVHTSALKNSFAWVEEEKDQLTFGQLGTRGISWIQLRIGGTPVSLDHIGDCVVAASISKTLKEACLRLVHMESLSEAFCMSLSPHHVPAKVTTINNCVVMSSYHTQRKVGFLSLFSRVEKRHGIELSISLQLGSVVEREQASFAMCAIGSDVVCGEGGSVHVWRVAGDKLELVTSLATPHQSLVISVSAIRDGDSYNIFVCSFSSPLCVMRLEDDTLTLIALGQSPILAASAAPLSLDSATVVSVDGHITITGFNTSVPPTVNPHAALPQPVTDIDEAVEAEWIEGDLDADERVWGKEEEEEEKEVAPALVLPLESLAARKTSEVFSDTCSGHFGLATVKVIVRDGCLIPCNEPPCSTVSVSAGGSVRTIEQVSQQTYQVLVEVQRELTGEECHPVVQDVVSRYLENEHQSEIATRVSNRLGRVVDKEEIIHVIKSM